MHLTARDVAFAHGRGLPRVLVAASISVGLGETVALLGPSGSGKTTFLSLLGGLLVPQEGKVGVDHGDGRPQDPRDHVSWVLQTTNLLPDRDVLHNCAIAALGDGQRLGVAEERAAVALELVGLGPLADRPARTLSGGEAQRVAISRALASRRPFVLADEPTGQLDRRTTAGVLDALFRIDAHRAVVVVTHDPDVAERCSRVVRLLDGRVVAGAAA